MNERVKFKFGENKKTGTVIDIKTVNNPSSIQDIIFIIRGDDNEYYKTNHYHCKYIGNEKELAKDPNQGILL